MLARLFRDLAPFQPTLVGTYPLGLQVDGSELAILCTCGELDGFERTLRALLSGLGVTQPRFDRLALPAVVAAFELDGVAIEIIAQAIPVHAQAGFRRLVIEGQLLVLGGADLHACIHELKRSGLETEPAFAHALGLAGDPDAALLALETWSPERLRGLVERALHPVPAAAIALYTGDRAALVPLFRIADDSEPEIASYLPRGDILVARVAGTPVGHVQVIEDAAAATWELKSVAVIDEQRGLGLGRRLVEAGLAHARDRGATRVVLSTATADTHLLRFYQRIGFRMLRIERDVFTPAAGYPADLYVDGVRLLDQIWFDITW